MDVERLVAAARQQGWRVERTRKGHWRFVPPEPTGAVVLAGGTPSDRRAARNLLAGLRRAGLAWPPDRS
jgi:predicted RNA binding protein YcfA (HicA-like mRNA interferase family)